MQNSKGHIFYGLHMYPGVAEYSEPGKEPYRIFLNEDTIRAMGPSFAGRPVFVQHTDEVCPDINQLRAEADGFVVESFYNESDGKHWVKFLVVSDRGMDAISKGWKLSNCYIPKAFSNGGQWNGVSYSKEVKSGEYEHLAIVSDPRYEESIILTPTQFKEYNESKKVELHRLTNNKKGSSMKISFFKKSKVENSMDMEEISVLLPVTKKEMTIKELVEFADKKPVQNAKIKVGETEMSQDELVKEFLAATAEIARLENAKKCNEDDEDDKKENADDEDDEDKKENAEMDDDLDDVLDDESVENEDDEDDDDAVENADDDETAKKKALELAEHEEKEIAAKKNKKKNSKEAAEKALRLKNAGPTRHTEPVRVLLPQDRVNLGRNLYGS